MALDGREGDAENNEGLPAYEKQASLILSAERVFIGQCPKLGASFDGNSMLLHLEGMKYVFVGVLVFSFTSTSRITKYASLVGNNDVPYPWAIDEQGWQTLTTSPGLILNNGSYRKQSQLGLIVTFRISIEWPDKAADI